MRTYLFRGAVVFSLALVLAPDLLPTFEPPTVEAAPRRRSNRRYSRSQGARARAARAVQQRRLRNQRVARLNRARATRNRAYANNRARANAIARRNAYRPGYRPNPYAARPNPYALAAAQAAYAPVIIYKDYQLQLGENLSVGSLTPLGRKATVEDVDVGQTVSVTLVRDPSAGKNQGAPGQLTGQVVKMESNSAAQQLTVRVASYQYGGRAGETTTVPPAPGQSVSGITIRSKASGNAAGLFKQ